MAKVYVIQSAVIEDNNLEDPRWRNLYCVSSLQEAKKCVSRCQSDAGSVSCDFPVHYMYRFEELVKYSL